MNSKAVRVIGVLGTLWNLTGVGAYLAHVGMFGPDAAATPPGAAAMPAAIVAAFATAVFSGVAGRVGLALLKRWAAPMLWLCFVASVINWGWVFGYGKVDERPLGVAVTVIALALAIVASRKPRTAVGTV